MLADRVGIIDHGRIVAEGTPAALKAEIGRPTVEVVPADPADARAHGRRSSPASASRCGSTKRRRRAAADGRGRPRRASCARSTPRASRSRRSQLHQPTLDDVFLAKTGRSLEGADDDEEPDAAAGVGCGRAVSRACRRPGLPARPPLGRAHAAPAGQRRRAGGLPADAAGGQLRRAAGRDPPAGLPDRLLSWRSRSPCRSSRARCSRP